MHRYTWIIAAALAGALAACGSDDTSSSSSSSGGTDTGSSSSGADGASSSSGGDASSSGGDASSSGGDASSGGAACIPTFVTPTMDWKTGCTSADDIKFLQSLSKDQAAASSFGDTVKDCTVPNLGKTEAEGIKAIGTCIDDKSDLGADCSTCYAVDSWCAGKKCLQPCLLAPTGKECGDCRACNCEPAAGVCKAGKK